MNFNIEKLETYVTYCSQGEVNNFLYRDGTFNIKLALIKSNNELELMTFYREKDKTESKGYCIKVLWILIDCLLENNYINFETIFKLEIEYTPSKKLHKYFNKCGFRKYNEYTSFYEYKVVQMKQSIKHFLDKVIF
jgi:hypothetical protein